jgi:nitroreductase
MNPTLDLMNRRCSTRAYAPTPITDEEKRAILETTMRAPTAGNLMLYSILEIDDQAIKDRLAVTCDDQPFIAEAPWVLVFVADYQKWMDLFAVSDAYAVPGVAQRPTPGVGDLLLACCDALIAAQNAVIAAESLGIGSCYIGDVLEQAETHAELLGLPNHTLPIAMLCLGRPEKTPRITPRYTKHVVHKNTYKRLGDEQLRRVASDLDPRAVYTRKFAADFTIELNRSVERWIERWQTPQA